jgi:hypothetical protein
MIDLHERLSEFSYGYGVTREVEALLVGVGLQATPFLPSLLHEASLGFDVSFNSPGTVVLLQFKLGSELKRFHRSPPSQPIPLLERPFWRFSVDASEHQFQRLAEYEQANAEVYYVAPRFSDWAAYDLAFQNGEILDRSLMLTPSEIQRGLGGASGVHRIVYDRERRYVCSEPVPLHEETRQSLAERIGMSARDARQSLETRIGRILHRESHDQASMRMSERRRAEIVARARRPIDANAAIIGLEAWSQGAQIIFVTSSKG